MTLTEPQKLAYQKPKLSVVLSFRNEEAVLPELIRRLRAVLRQQSAEDHLRDYELIFVNDQSLDRSEEILRNEAVGSDDIRIVTMSRNFGVSPCVLAGMKYSTGDLVVYMDADLQDPPEVIPEMIKAWRDGQNVDVVNTVRLSRAGESPIKLWVTQLGYRILRSVSTIDLQIEAGDFKLLSRRFVNHLIQCEENGPFLRGLIQWIGFDRATVYYRREPRFAGDTKFPVFSPKVLRNFFSSALVSFSDLPLQLASFLGLLSSLAAFVVLIDVIIEKILGRNLPGWTAIMVALLFLSGIQLLSIGILGLYIHSIYLESKRRPNYIVKHTFGFNNSADLPLEVPPTTNYGT